MENAIALRIFSDTLRDSDAMADPNIARSSAFETNPPPAHL
jgi:hypothetical protein